MTRRKQEAGNLTASQSGGTRPRGRIQASLLCWEVIGGLKLDVVLMESCNKLQVIHEAAAQRRRSNNGCLLRLCATAFDSGDW